MANELAYAFQVGHRVGLILTSSNYPRFDANPGNGDDFYTDPSVSVSVTHTVIYSTDSYLVVPVF